MSFSAKKRSWFSWFNRTPRRKPRLNPSAHFFRPSLEALEDRNLLSPVLITDTTKFPFSAVVQTVTTWPDGAHAQGTGTMVNPNTVLTAGHVVYDYAHGGWAQSIQVIAGRNGNSEPYGVAYKTRDKTFTVFMADDKVNSENHPKGDGDIGFISLNRNLGYLTGWLGFSGGQSTSYNYQVGKVGYPGEDGYDGTHMYDNYGGTNIGGPGTNSNFAYWGWSTSSMTALKGESGSSLVLDVNGHLGIIGVQDLGNPNEGYAEVTTQAVINVLRDFEKAYPPLTAPSPPPVPSPPPQPTLQDDFALLFEGFEFELYQLIATILPSYGAAAGQAHAAAEANPAWNTSFGNLFWEVGMMYAEQALSGNHNS